MKDKLEAHNLKVILIQIDEAHSDAWPLGLKDQPPAHKSFQERLDRANHFIKLYDPPYPVFVDNWNNEFADLFRAWPDKFHCVDRDLKVVAKSEYGKFEDALIDKDYIEVLNDLMIEDL